MSIWIFRIAKIASRPPNLLKISRGLRPLAATPARGSAPGPRKNPRGPETIVTPLVWLSTIYISVLLLICKIAFQQVQRYAPYTIVFNFSNKFTVIKCIKTFA